MVYFKNPRMRELDSDLGDLQGALMDRQGHLIRELENLILNDELSLNCCAYALGELDVFISLASMAAEFNFVKPEMVEEDVIIVKEGRHPLQGQDKEEMDSIIDKVQALNFSPFFFCT